ncbi:MAG TPA: 1-aminocyclopropane-1-carboxylate deaminase/D-cysteine desulfhydrase, partial [Bacteroidia bacterium]
KTDERLWQFISLFEELYSIPLDQVYTGKMMFAVFDLAKKKYFQEGETVVAVHTGGLQGRQLNAGRGSF